MIWQYENTLYSTIRLKDYKMLDVILENITPIIA